MATIATKGTWEMTALELAKTYCHEVGIKHRAGGHFYGPDGRHIAQGWEQMVERLQWRGIIRAGVGINWRRSRYAPGPQLIPPKKSCSCCPTVKG